jgi:hypothetical protein
VRRKFVDSNVTLRLRIDDDRAHDGPPYERSRLPALRRRIWADRADDKPSI